jgi:uncharacterized membrane-anchored protein
MRTSVAAVFRWGVALLVAVTGSSLARADDPAPANEAPAESSSASNASPSVQFSWRGGPATIDLGHDISLMLPAQHAFLSGPDGARLLEKNGSFHNENLVGLVVGKSREARWFVTIRYDDEGYVKDNEAIDADALLKAMKEGTEQANEERKSHGFAPFHVQGWSEPPHYEKKVHHLVWALTVKGDDGESVNFNTRVLGRRGIVSLNLVCDPQDLEADKPEVAALLENTTFKSGARYEDFDAKSDRVAEYGLAGLILGGVGLGAAKLVKIGLIAKFWKVIVAALIAGKKAIVLFLAGGAAFVKKLFGRKKAAASPSPSPPTSG